MQLDEPVEQVVRVVRPGCRLRVVLHGEGRHVQAPQALDDVVVQADVADLDRAELGLGTPVERRVDGEAVVVAVISTLPVTRSSTGWLMPRCP